MYIKSLFFSTACAMSLFFKDEFGSQEVDHVYQDNMSLKMQIPGAFETISIPEFLACTRNFRY